MSRYQLINKGVRDLTTGVDIPPDRSSAAWKEYQEWFAAGNKPLPHEPPAPPPPPTSSEVQALVVADTQERLDLWARTRGYDGILSACTYAASTVPKFAAEGQAAVVARDATWAALYALLDAVMAGTQPMPAGFADVLPMLPDLAWPE